MGGIFGGIGDFFTTGGGAILGNNKFADPAGVFQGKREGQLTSEQVEAARQQNEISRALFSQATAPSLQLMFGAPGGEGEAGIFPEFLRTGELPRALSVEPAFASARDTTERQFQNARNAIISRTPARGGQLNSLLAENEFQRAVALGDLTLREELTDAPIRERFFAQGFNTAFGFPTTSLAGLGSAASQFGSAADRAAGIQRQREEQFSENMGLMASMFKKGG